MKTASTRVREHHQCVELWLAGIRIDFVDVGIGPALLPRTLDFPEGVAWCFIGLHRGVHRGAVYRLGVIQRRIRGLKSGS